MADIGVKLTGDNSEYKGMLDDSVKKTESFGAKLSDKLVDKITGLRDVSTAVATALGLNIQTIAENIARGLTGMTKEAEAALQRLDAASQKSADAAIANMRSQLGDEKQLVLLKQERERLQKIVTEGAKAEADYVLQIMDDYANVVETKFKGIVTEKELARIKEAELALNEKITAIQQLEKEIKEKKLAVTKEEEKATVSIAATEEKRRDSQREENTLSDQRKSILAEIKATEEEIVQLEAEGYQGAKERKRIEELRGQLTEVEKKQGSENLEIAKLMLKGAENLTAEEKVKLQILTGQTTQKKIDAEIAQLTAKSLTGELLPAEKERLAVLVGQSAELKEQLTKMTGLTAEAKAFVLTISRKGASYEDQSTVALEGVQARLKSQLQKLQAENAIATPSQRNPFEWSVASELQNVTRELDSRKIVGSFASRFGEDAARAKYGDSTTDKALRDMTDAATRTQQGIAELNRRLESSGLFPLRGGTPPT